MGHRPASRLRGVAALTALLLAWTGGAAAAQEDAAVTYRIGPKDKIGIQVVEEPSLNQEARVSEAGTLLLPLVGELAIAGLTEEEAGELLRERLEESFLQRATVTLRVIEYRSRPISVVGAVTKPGNLELSGRWNLLDAISDAGGLTGDHGGIVQILRRADNGLSDQLTIDVEDLLVRADPNVNVPVFSNDVISVPAASSITVYLLGEVARTGAVNFRGDERPTLLAAIAQAGGLSDRAANRIAIKRLTEQGSRREIVAHYKRLLAGSEPDPVLQDGDLIVVKESFF